VNAVSLSGLVHKTVHSQLSAKKSHEFCLGAGLFVSNRAHMPRVLDKFPFCVRFDASKAAKALKSGILQQTLHDFDLAMLADMGFLEPRYLSINNEVKVLTFRAAINARIPVGFTVIDDILVFCDSYSRIIVPTFDTIMYMIAVSENLPETLRIKAYNSYSNAPERNIFRSYLQYDDALEQALIDIRRLAIKQDGEGGEYTPQSGTLSSCVQAKDAIQTCITDVQVSANHALTPFLEKCGLPSDIPTLALHLATCRKPLYSIAAFIILYMLIRFLVDFCLTMRFVAGCLVGTLLPRPPKKSVSLYDSLFTPQSGQIEPTAEVPEGELEQPSAPSQSEGSSTTTPSVVRPSMASHHIMEAVRAQTTRDIQNWRRNPQLYPLPRDILNRGIAFPAVLQAQLHDALNYKPTAKHTLGYGAGLKDLR